MARLVSALFCEYHSTDNRGLNTYGGVFDNKTMVVTVPPDKPLPTFPLSQPIPCGGFTLAMYFESAPAVESELRIEVQDSDKQNVVPPIRQKIAPHPEGKHRVHAKFENGIPVSNSGTYSFEMYVNNQHIGTIQLPVFMEIKHSDS